MPRVNSSTIGRMANFIEFIIARDSLANSHKYTTNVAVGQPTPTRRGAEAFASCARCSQAVSLVFRQAKYSFGDNILLNVRGAATDNDIRPAE